MIRVCSVFRFMRSQSKAERIACLSPVGHIAKRMVRSGSE